MVTTLLVVNGIPGSGKTTLAKPLARELAIPLIAKDSIKEALSDAVGGGLPTSPLGGIATDVLWRLAGLFSGSVMIESFWATGRDEQYFQRGYESIGAPAGVEVWCTAPIELTVQRYMTRARHAAHDDARRLAEMRDLASIAAPISGLPVVPVDTSTRVDLTALAHRLAHSVHRDL